MSVDFLDMRQINISEFLGALEATRRTYHDNYFAMYSSFLGGIVTDPVLMFVPADDHLVHRGDGVFETFKCVNGSIYNLKGHLDRLEHSASAVSLPLPCSQEGIEDIAAETIRAGKSRNCLVRIMISRGPGGYDANPYESVGSQMYVIVSMLKDPFMKLHPEGARVVTVPVRTSGESLSIVKTCNYIPNVLMKKEAVDRNVDFAAGIDERGCLTEGATENFGIVADGPRLVFPPLHAVLAGTTMMRVADLARALVKSGQLRSVEFKDITRDDAGNALEILIVGTTRNVISVVELDGSTVGNGRPGPVAETLGALLEKDILENAEMLTRVMQ
ncbi:MAG: peptidase [Lentisphaerales bacterium]|jgi:branched-chain amino acid aminotransferase|nr:MAG: peptidase [Lentisphaerales bacterium]